MTREILIPKLVSLCYLFCSLHLLVHTTRAVLIHSTLLLLRTRTRSGSCGWSVLRAKA